MIKNKLVVVIGGVGFIGFYIVWEFIKDNDVVIIDNLYIGKEENVLLGVKFVKVDIRDYEVIVELISNVDYVFYEVV